MDQRMSGRDARPDEIRVMICDDSAVIRSAVSRVLETDKSINVVARANNGQTALESLRRQQVDVVILDIEMPVMDGMTALPLLLEAAPGIRVIISSTLTTRGADIALQALRLGAEDYIAKPGATDIGTEAFRAELLAKVWGLARLRRSTMQAKPTVDAIKLRPVGKTPKLVVIGSSTGGPQALFTLVQGLARDNADLRLPIALTQHTPPEFSSILARHITALKGPSCVEAQHGQVLAPGTIHLAPGSRHLMIERRGKHLVARLWDGPAENFCRPAVDPMLRSATEACDGGLLGVMLTGMGQDGLAGTRLMVEAGGTCIAQDEATSVVWGMPGAVARAGLCHAILPLSEIASKIAKLTKAR